MSTTIGISRNSQKSSFFFTDFWDSFAEFWDCFCRTLRWWGDDEGPGVTPRITPRVTRAGQTSNGWKKWLKRKFSAKWPRSDCVWKPCCEIFEKRKVVKNQDEELPAKSSDGPPGISTTWWAQIQSKQIHKFILKVFPKKEGLASILALVMYGSSIFESGVGVYPACDPVYDPMILSCHPVSES